MKDYKKVITKNGNIYMGYYISDTEFMTTFGWTLQIKDIKYEYDSRQKQ